MHSEANLKEVFLYLAQLDIISLELFVSTVKKDMFVKQDQQQQLQQIMWRDIYALRATIVIQSYQPLKFLAPLELIEISSKVEQWTIAFYVLLTPTKTQLQVLFANPAEQELIQVKEAQIVLQLESLEFGCLQLATQLVWKDIQEYLKQMMSLIAHQLFWIHVDHPLISEQTTLAFLVEMVALITQSIKFVSVRQP